ncbi:MAG: glycosyltransferase [Thermodesulfobacteriota bacterium]
MKLLHIIADGRPGGGTTLTLALIEDLRGLGHEVSFVCQEGSYAVGEARKLGIQTHGIDFFRSRLDIGVAIKLKRIVEQNRPDLVHVHGGRAGYFLSLGLPTRKSLAAVYTVHGYHFPAKPWGYRHLGAMAERRISRWADMTVHVSQYDRALAKQWRLLPTSSKSTVVPNGIRPEDIAVRRPADPTCIGFLGRLSFPKDPLLFIETVRLLASEGYSAKIVGGGDMEGDVKRAIEKYDLSNHVRLLGSLPRRTALAEIADAAVAVFPTRWEGLPLAPLELMHMGIPIVAAHAGGTTEIIEHGVSGILVRDRDPVQYADAVRKITRDPDYRDRLVRNAKLVVRDRFTQKRVTEQYIQVYSSLLSA